ncbi:MAG: hypothetical protein C0623_09300 [Desulfuromonas sp.]|nr:MAG: hypothetical protein C0623_09300 [Desulfuromonas sp.]
MLSRFIDWCRRHVLLVTVLAFILVVAFGFVNIQILHMTSEPEFCHLCHPAKGFGALAEVDSWEHSAHGEAGVSCLDCHGRPGVVGYMKAKLGGLKDTYMQLTISAEEKLEILQNPGPGLVPAHHCLFCHSDEGNKEVREATKGPMKLVKMRMLDDVVNPEFRLRKGLPDIMTDTFVGGTNFDHSLHMDGFDFVCRDCHFGVVHNPTTKTDRMNFCIACHAENNDSDAPQMNDCESCHQAQFSMNKGTGARGITGENSIMFNDEMGCQDCHTTVSKGVYRPSKETCVDCHDEDYIGVFEEWASDTKAKVAELRELRVDVESALVEADSNKRDTEALWTRYENALYNLQFVEDDGTKGVHNYDYAVEVLAGVEKDFNSVLSELDAKW